MTALSPHSNTNWLSSTWSTVQHRTVSVLYSRGSPSISRSYTGWKTSINPNPSIVVLVPRPPSFVASRRMGRSNEPDYNCPNCQFSAHAKIGRPLYISSSRDVVYEGVARVCTVWGFGGSRPLSLFGSPCIFKHGLVAERVFCKQSIHKTSPLPPLAQPCLRPYSVAPYISNLVERLQSVKNPGDFTCGAFLCLSQLCASTEWTD